MNTDNGFTRDDVDYYLSTTREMVKRLNPLEPDEWRSCNRLCGHFWDELVACRFSEGSGDYSTKNSSVPRKILKFAMSPDKYVSEMRLIAALSDALSGEKDVSMLRIEYERAFGEPFCTLTDDRRVKIVLEVMESAWRCSHSHLFARSLIAFGPLRVPGRATITEGANGGGVKGAGDNRGSGLADEVELNSALVEAARLEMRLRALLGELRALDPKLARIATDYAYGY